MLCSLCQSANAAEAQRCRACGSALQARNASTTATPDALSAGTLLAGVYAVEAVLGQGGFGITYRCRDAMLDRPVAVKEFFPSGCRRHNLEVVPSRGLSDANFREARAQFLAEARLLARCHHAGIVGVHAAFEANATAYMVMELLHGQTLSQLLEARRGCMDEAEAVAIIERVGEALQFVHEQNLLHRDIKPDNILMCDDGRVMLIDFGTARETVAGQVQGQTVVVTPGYAPLEQYARQARRGPFTDVYSLAATIYHLLTGQMPPAASDRAMGVELRPLRELNPQISASVARAVEGALQMEIARRPQSVRAFLDLLHAPAHEIEVESYFAPPVALWSREDEDETSDELPAALTPDALRAQQSVWQAPLPVGNAQMVKLAPPRAFPLAAHPPVAATSPVAHGSAGGVRVQNSSNPEKISWWALGILCGGIALFALVNASSSRQPAPAPAPQFQSPSSANFNASRYALAPDPQQRAEATRKWNALPVSVPTSVELLPGTKATTTATSSWGAVEFSPDGSRLAYVDNRAVLRVMSLPDRRILNELSLDKARSPVEAMFSPDNRTLAVVQVGGEKATKIGFSGRVEAWDLRNNKRTGVFTVGAPDYTVWPAAVLNDGRLLLKTGKINDAQSAQLFVWNSKTGKRSSPPFALPKTASWGHGAIAPDGQTFVLGDGRGQLSWIDLKTGQTRHRQNMMLTRGDHQQRFGELPPGFVDAPLGVRGVDYSLNGAYLASRSEGQIRVFDNKARQLGSLAVTSRSSMFFSVSPDGEWVAVAGQLPMTPAGQLLWNRKTDQIIRLSTPSRTLLDFGFSRDGQQLYGIFSSQEGQIQMATWPVGKTTTPPFQRTGETSFPADLPSDNALLIATQSAGEVAVARESEVEIYRKNGRRLHSIGLKMPEVQALQLAPDGRFLAAGGTDGTLQLWDVVAGRALFVGAGAATAPQNPRAPVADMGRHTLAFSPDGRYFAGAQTRGETQSVELWSLAGKPRPLASLAQKGPLSALLFTPDGKSLICGEAKGGLRWFDVAARRYQSGIETGDELLNLAYGGRSLLAMGNQSARGYRLSPNADPLRGGAITQFSPDFMESYDALSALALSPDGQWAAMATSSAGVQIWSVPKQTMVQQLPAEQSVKASDIGSLQFSSDGTQLTAVGRERDKSQIFVRTYRLAR